MQRGVKIYHRISRESNQSNQTDHSNHRIQYKRDNETTRETMRLRDGSRDRIGATDNVCMGKMHVAQCLAVEGSEEKGREVFAQ